MKVQATPNAASAVIVDVLRVAGSGASALPCLILVLIPCDNLENIAFNGQSHSTIKTDQMEEKKAKKISFFKELNELDESDDESEDTSKIDLILRQSKSPPHSLSKQPLRSCYPLARTSSAPLPNSSSHAPNEVHMIQDRPCPSPVPMVSSDLSFQVTVDGHKMPNGGVTATSINPLSKSKGKRKRGQSLEPIPDSQQIFKGLAFCMAFTLVRLLRRILKDEM